MIPVNEPFIGPREVEYVNECLRTGWISSAGRFIEEFESRWAAYCGRKYGIAMSNGTTALQAAVACLNLKPGFQVLMPTFTIISCALAVIYNGGIPVLVDCDPCTWCLDVEQARTRIEADVQSGARRIKAIMPVHIYGHPVDMDPLLELAQKYDLKIIEDAAEVHGAEYLTGRNTPHPQWQRCGSFGDLSVFSFYANKLITTGEGGMVLTNDEHLADRARRLRNLCFQPEQRFLHTELGHNFRLTNLQAAIGLAQLERIDEIIAKKRWIGRTYTERLQDVPGLQLSVEEPWARQVYWMYGIVLDEATGMDAKTFAAHLREQGVETRPFFLGMHEQPVFQAQQFRHTDNEIAVAIQSSPDVMFNEESLFANEHYPIAVRISRRGLYLPSGLSLTKTQIEQICSIVKSLLTTESVV